MRINWRHIIFGLILLGKQSDSKAQAAMPDTVCAGTQRIYRVNDASVPSTYIWKINGAIQTSQTHELIITWTLPGTYDLTVQEMSANGCLGDIRSGTVLVVAPPNAQAGPDMVICYLAPARLQGSGGASYQWTPSGLLNNATIPDPQVRLTTPGTYDFYLTVRSIGCSGEDKDTVRVTMLPPVEVFAGNDTSVAINQVIQLHAQILSGGNIATYAWSPPAGLNDPFIANPQLTLNTPGTHTYRVSVRNEIGCADTDDIQIKVFAAADIYVPTAFTPNYDGLNDLAKAIPVGMREFSYFRIYNRWGELVFATADSSKGWDGLFRGKEQDTNVFVWEARAIDMNGNVVFRKGTVTLIR